MLLGSSALKRYSHAFEIGIFITYENEIGGFFTRGHEGNCCVSSSEEEVLRLDKEPVVDRLTLLVSPAGRDQINIEEWIERPFPRLFWLGVLGRTSVGPWVPNRGTGVVHAQRAV